MAIIDTNNGWGAWLIAVLLLLLAGFTGAGISIALISSLKESSVKIEGDFQIELSEEQVPTVMEDDKGEITEELYPTVEEVDGGMFEDEATGVSVQEGEYADLGWSETYDVSSPDAFKDATLGKCIIANNRYGAQCVSLSRVFWWSYADRDVSTCGTGAAKGMMNCAEQNAGDDFEIYWKENVAKIQPGDWLIFEGGAWGHVGMALGPVTNGYVALLGENQGGKACDGGGSSTNIINISTKNLIGFYRPKAYIKPEPKPEPEPTKDHETLSPNEYTVKKGDTLGGIILELGWYDGTKLFGDDGCAQKVAGANKIKNRGLITPGQTIRRVECAL